MLTILIDPTLCVTHSTDPVKVKKYINSIKEGSIFPPIEAVEIDGIFYIKDGAHRVRAHLELNEFILAQVFEPEDYESKWLIGRRFSFKKNNL